MSLYFHSKGHTSCFFLWSVLTWIKVEEKSWEERRILPIFEEIIPKFFSFSKPGLIGWNSFFSLIELIGDRKREKIIWDLVYFNPKTFPTYEFSFKKSGLPQMLFFKKKGFQVDQKKKVPQNPLEMVDSTFGLPWSRLISCDFCFLKFWIWTNEIVEFFYR